MERSGLAAERSFFFNKMGIEKNILWKQPEFYYMQEGGKEAVLRFANLPAPFHAAVAFANLLKSYTGIPKWKLLFTAAGMGGAVLYSNRKLEQLDDITFGLIAVPRRAPSCPWSRGSTVSPSPPPG